MEKSKTNKKNKDKEVDYISDKNSDARVPNDFEFVSEKEKVYTVRMRCSSTFFKDGLKRLKKNKVALISFFVLVFITLVAIFVPMFWPYKYDQILGMQPGKVVDNTFINLPLFKQERSEV